MPTAPGRHPKRGGWKGAKRSRRNHNAHGQWMERKKFGRPEQFWVVSPINLRPLPLGLEPGMITNARKIPGLIPLRGPVR